MTLVAVLLVEIWGRHSGQDPRDPAVPVPEIWDRDSRDLRYPPEIPGVGLGLKSENPGSGTGTETRNSKIRDP